jgi:transposase
MNRRSKVELFEQLRREFQHGVGTVAGVARKFGVHRRMVRDAIASAVPAPRKTSVRGKPKIEPVQPWIDEILEADRKAPRKQRHTARRIFHRLRQEHPEQAVAESTVRQYVREWKARMGNGPQEVFIAQTYAWAQEAQVDWYEAWADLDGQRRKVYVFCLRSMASGGAFHRAYPHASQQAFLEAHEHAFAYFGGVFARLRYDNLKSAVKKILRGYQREETERFIAFRSHWGFHSEFCNPASGHEKGGVENEGGYFRRNHLVPVPVVPDWVQLNEFLLEGCRQDEHRTLAGQAQTVGAAMAIEREQLRPLAPESFDLAEISFPAIDRSGCVKVRTNFYSAPVPVGAQVTVRLHAAHVEIWHGGQCMAHHERCFERHQKVLSLDHYLAELLRKPGAMAGSTALEQCRQQGRWPAAFDRYWEMLRTRHGRAQGTRAMIELLLLGREKGPGPLRQAVEQALEAGCSDTAAVRYFLHEHGLTRPPAEAVDVGDLSRYDRPAPSLNSYDLLLLQRASITEARQ